MSLLNLERHDDGLDVDLRSSLHMHHHALSVHNSVRLHQSLVTSPSSLLISLTTNQDHGQSRVVSPEQWKILRQ